MKSSRMKHAGIAGLVTLGLMLSGCMTPPKNPAEFRAMGKEGKYFLSSETLTVKRPYAQVVQTYKQRAPACFNIVVETSTKQGYTRTTEKREWTSHVTATGKHMECTLQSKITGGNVKELIDYPNKDGHYMFMVDAYPVNQHSTRIVITQAPMLAESLTQAAKNWAEGVNMGCPDF